MKKFILILSVILVLFFAGCINPPEPVLVPEELTKEKAIEIAQLGDCAKIGTLTEEISFDEISKSWRIKIKPFEVEPNCNAFCVVWEDKTVEVNWKCGGEKLEPVVDDSEFLEQECDAVKRCPEGFECASFPLVGLKCYPLEEESFPCSFVQCPSRHYCVVAESYPVQVNCSPISISKEFYCSADKDCAPCSNSECSNINYTETADCPGNRCGTYIKECKCIENKCTAITGNSFEDRGEAIPKC